MSIKHVVLFASFISMAAAVQLYQWSDWKPVSAVSLQYRENPAPYTIGLEIKNTGADPVDCVLIVTVAGAPLPKDANLSEKLDDLIKRQTAVTVKLAPHGKPGDQMATSVGNDPTWPGRINNIWVK
jgi:hypothetical protein